MGEVKLPKVKLPDGCEVVYFPFDDPLFAVARLELIIGFHQVLKLYGDGDFADGHAMLKKRDKEIAEWEREEKDREEKGYS